MKAFNAKTFFGLALILATNMAFQCDNKALPFPEGESTYCSDISWLKDIAESLSSNAEVVRYTYKGETVYLINTCVDCADTMDQVYNCSGKIICQFGGIAGFNTCPDFFDVATNKKVIWKN